MVPILKVFLLLGLLLPLQARGEKVQIYSDEEVRQALYAYIQSRSEKEEKKEILTLEDPDSKREDPILRLELIEIHPEVKRLGSGDYLTCVDFRVPGGSEGQIYDIDFWLFPDEDGNLTVKEFKVHKEPVFVSGKWTSKARYTLIN